MKKLLKTFLIIGASLLVAFTLFGGYELIQGNWFAHAGFVTVSIVIFGLALVITGIVFLIIQITKI